MKPILFTLISLLLLFTQNCTQRAGKGELPVVSEDSIDTGGDGADSGEAGANIGGRDREGDDTVAEGRAENGINCWDINMNRINDSEEDTNKDGAFDILDCQATLNTSNCRKDQSGKCVVVSDLLPCQKNNSCGADIDTNIMNPCQGGEFKPPKDILNATQDGLQTKGCLYECSNWMMEEEGKECKSTFRNQAGQIEEGVLMSAENCVVEYFRNGVWGCDCAKKCADELCLDIVMDKDSILENSDICDLNAKIPGYYEKLHFKVTTCTARWHLLKIYQNQLAWDSITGSLKAKVDNGNGGKKETQIKIYDYFTIAMNRHCATNHGDGVFYNRAEVELSGEKNGGSSEVKEVYNWFAPGYSSFGFSKFIEEKLGYLIDYSGSYFVSLTNATGPGLFIPRILPTEASDTFSFTSGRIFVIESIFWWDPIISLEFDLYFKPLAVQ